MEAGRRRRRRKLLEYLRSHAVRRMERHSYMKAGESDCVDRASSRIQPSALIGKGECGANSSSTASGELD